MLASLPSYYENSRVIHSILQAQGTEVDNLTLALDDVLSQFFINTATWNLETWEKELGLNKAEEIPQAKRRDRIISKLRGTGTATLKVIKDVAESYENGSVEVIEDQRGYLITLKFVDTMGVPSNMDTLRSVLRSVVPAHLEILFKYRYLIWKELTSLQLTWQQITELHMTWAEWQTYTCMQWNEMDLLDLTWNQLDSLTVSWNDWEVYV